MPSLSNNLDSQTTVPYVNAIVQVQQNWGDGWEFAEYLECLSCKRCAAPQVGVARFRYRSGFIKREDSNSFAQYDPVDVRGWFVRVLTQNQGSDPTIHWVGQIEDESIAYLEEGRASGDEELIAYGLEHILDRNIISTTFVDGVDLPLDWVMPFNERPQRGHELKGNRADVENEDGVFLFSSDGNKWSNRQAIDYLLWAFTPEDMLFDLAGQVEPLNDMEEYFRFEGMTVWKALQRLIDADKGLCLTVGEDEDDTILLFVSTTSDFPIQVGDKTLPANDNQVNLTLPTDPPYDHLVEELPLTVTASNQFSEIRVRGARVRLLCPFVSEDFNASYAAPLDIGWKSNLEDEYKDAQSQDDADANDIFRASEKFDDVYQKFVVPESWDGKVGGENVMPIAMDDGTISMDTSDLPDGVESPPFVIWDKTFMRSTPLKKGFDYGASPPVDFNPSDVEPEFVPLIVLYSDGDDGENHTADNKWHHVRKLHDANEDVSNLTVSPLDKQLGIKVSVSPNHYLALNHFKTTLEEGDDADLLAKATNNEPELDYVNLLVVGQFETDVRPQYVFRSEQDNGRKLVKDVNSARYIVATPDCPVDVDGNGDLVFIHEDSRVFDDDKSVLQSIATQLLSWYSQKRQAIRIPINTVGYFVDVGSFLVNINTQFSTESIRTLITSVEVDFDKQITTIQTGCRELDYVELAGRAEDLTQWEDE